MNLTEGNKALPISDITRVLLIVHLSGVGPLPFYGGPAA